MVINTPIQPSDSYRTIPEISGGKSESIFWESDYYSDENKISYISLQWNWTKSLKKNE